MKINIILMRKANKKIQMLQKNWILNSKINILIKLMKKQRKVITVAKYLLEILMKIQKIFRFIVKKMFKMTKI